MLIQVAPKFAAGEDGVGAIALDADGVLGIKELVERDRDGREGCRGDRRRGLAAEELAAAAGLTVGRVQSIAEEGGAPQPSSIGRRGPTPR